MVEKLVKVSEKMWSEQVRRKMATDTKSKYFVEGMVTNTFSLLHNF